MGTRVYNSAGKSSTKSATGSPMDAPNEIAVKMCKKIAQLTKVIYALNTKLDDHEVALQSLQEGYEEEIKQMVTETENKLLQYKIKLETALDLQDRYDKIKGTLEESQTIKKGLQDEIEQIKLTNLEENKILKNDYESKLKEIENQLQDVTDDRDKTVSHLKEIKQASINNLESVADSLKENHSREVEAIKLALNEKVAKLDEEIVTLKSTYEKEIEQLKQDHQAELHMIKNTEANSHQDYIDQLKKKIEDTNRSLSEKETEHEKVINEMKTDFVAKEEYIHILQDQLQKIQFEKESSNSVTYGIEKQLGDAQVEIAKAAYRINEMETALSIANERGDEHENLLLKKDAELLKLSEINRQLESKVNEMNVTVTTAMEQMKLYNSEKTDVVSRYKVESELKNKRIKVLQNEIEKLSAERAEMRSIFEKEKELAASKAADRQMQIQAEFTQQLELRKREHKLEIDNLIKDAKNKLEEQKHQLDRIYDQDRSQIITNHEEVVNHLKSSISELNRAIDADRTELKRLNNFVHNSSEELTSKTTQIKSLKSKVTEYEGIVANKSAELETSQRQLSSLSNEINVIKNDFESRIRITEENHRKKLDDVSKDMLSFWSERLKNENLKLRAQLEETHLKDQQEALHKLTTIKDEEIAEVKFQANFQVKELQSKVLDLQQTLDTSSKEAKEREKEIIQETEEKISAMKKQIDMTTNDVTEEKTKVETQNEVSEQLKASQLAIEAIREQAERRRIADIKELQLVHQRSQDSLREDLSHQHMEELNKLNKQHAAQLQASRLELQRAMELRKRENQDHDNLVYELNFKIDQREIQIGDLQKQIAEINRKVDSLDSQSKAKDTEMEEIKKDASFQLRRQEEQLGVAHQAEMDSLAAEHMRDKQKMLGEFSQTKEFLHQKIAGLYEMLQESERRYANREPREEDVKQIAELKEILGLKDSEIKKLVDEKRFYQLELINREENYNKMFSRSPNVGVINPLVSTKKKQSNIRNSAKKDSRSNSPNGKLEPLSGTPTHNYSLNKTIPLPDQQFSVTKAQKRAVVS
ncbi:Protein FAM184A [Trichoplax sp. H2]|nr:Protein FAM184A [Trichoplax sp. H2]|eukprot:RDD41945.1 Protein FAM184A [Trichoplax sp. H2]